jgi:hypothetical protein
LKVEFQKVSVRADIAAGLADTFWVPKGVIRARLAQALTSNLDINAASSGTFVVSPRVQSSSIEVFDLSDDDLDEGPIVHPAPQPLATLN